MIRTRSLLVVPALALALGLPATAGCSRGDAGGKDLPPASGKGAAPMPTLPDVNATDDGAGGSSASASDGSQRTTGTTVPPDRAEVAPNMSGIIQSIAVDEGDKVKKGDVLYRLRTTDLSLRVQQARAAEKSAQVQLSAAKIEYDRMQRLLSKNAVEQAQFDKVQAQYQAAQVGVEQAKVAVQVARQGLADATVRSPIAGVVVAKLKNPGEMATMMPPTVVVVVEDQSSLELHFKLPESAVGSIHQGDQVTARFEAIGLDRTAKVEKVSPAVDPATRTVEITALLDNSDGALKSGMLAVIDVGAKAKASATPAPGSAGPAVTH